MSTGSVLYSRRSRPLLRIVEDEAGTHDFLYAPCSWENLTTSLAVFGVPAATVTIAFNVFMRVEVGPDGSLKIQPPISPRG